MEKLHTIKAFLEMAGRRMHTPHPTTLYSLSARGHKLQKPSKEFGIFQSLGTINFVIFTKKRSQKGGHGPMVPLLNTLQYKNFTNYTEGLLFLSRKK